MWGRGLAGGFLLRDGKSLGERREQLGSFWINPEPQSAFWVGLGQAPPPLPGAGPQPHLAGS